MLASLPRNACYFPIMKCEVRSSDVFFIPLPFSGRNKSLKHEIILHRTFINIVDPFIIIDMIFIIIHVYAPFFHLCVPVPCFATLSTCFKSWILLRLSIDFHLATILKVYSFSFPIF